MTKLQSVPGEAFFLQKLYVRNSLQLNILKLKHVLLDYKNKVKYKNQ